MLCIKVVEFKERREGRKGERGALDVVAA